jgi:catechol 2,3-dioxygenase-like lactoylglutathione lyase family enzyme
VPALSNEENIVQFSKLAIALSTRDVIASRDFCVGHFGSTPAAKHDWYVSLHHPEHPEQVLDLVSKDHPSIPAQFRCRSVDGSTLAFLVDDAAQGERRLRAAGVPIAEPLEDMPWEQRRFHLGAPKGTRVEIVQFLDTDAP